MDFYFRNASREKYRSAVMSGRSLNGMMMKLRKPGTTRGGKTEYELKKLSTDPGRKRLHELHGVAGIQTCAQSGLQRRWTGVRRYSSIIRFRSTHEAGIHQKGFVKNEIISAGSRLAVVRNF